MRLLQPGAVVGRLGAAIIPADLYWLARDPVALVGMSYPARIDWTQLATHGVGHVVCLTHDVAPYDPAPLTCSAFALADLYGGSVPADPAREQEVALDAARVVVSCVERGVGAAVHCHAGRGRTGTVLGAALVMLGHRPQQVVDYLDRLQRARGKPGWPESKWQADVVLAAPTGA